MNCLFRVLSVRINCNVKCCLRFLWVSECLYYINLLFWKMILYFYSFKKIILFAIRNSHWKYTSQYTLFIIWISFKSGVKHCKSIIRTFHAIYSLFIILSRKVLIPNLTFLIWDTRTLIVRSFLARLHFSAEELLLYPRRQRRRPRRRRRPHAKC